MTRSSRTFKRKATTDYTTSVDLNRKSELEKTAQHNTIHRVPHLCKMSGFRSVQHTDVSSQFKAALADVKEEVNFQSLLIVQVGQMGWRKSSRSLFSQ